MGDRSTTSGITTFAVNKKDISKLYIYVFADDYEKSDGIINMDAASEQAVVSAIVEIK